MFDSFFGKASYSNIAGQSIHKMNVKHYDDTFEESFDQSEYDFGELELVTS